jgi:hypothetical protein
MELLFDFNKDASLQDWRIVDDIVMGGKSASRFSLSPLGFGLFEGKISLENNGGFSSVSYRFKKIKVSEDSCILLRLKGDGKNYQLRVKDNSSHSYYSITLFATSGEWQEIKIRLKELYPSFRGRKLDLAHFSQDSIEELVFLIGNKKAEAFQLLIDKIALV